MRYLFMIVAAFTLFGCNNAPDHMEGTKWYSEHKGPTADTLTFINDLEVRYYMAALPWQFNSRYLRHGDTLTLYTVTSDVDVEKEVDLEQNLTEKFVLDGDRLRFIKSKKGAEQEAEERVFRLVN